VRVNLLLDRAVEARAVSQFQPERIARQDRFAEADQLRAGIGRIVYGAFDLGECRCAIESDGRDLGGGDPQA